MRQIEITSDLVAQVRDIAHEAGVAILHVYTEMRSSDAGVAGVLVAHKADDSPLTRADLVAHTLIGQRLAVLTPDIQVVSEEEEQSLKHLRPLGDFWLVDPLDGTKEFLAQNGEFTVNIALVRDGEAVFGVVVAPALGQTYWGAKGLGAFRETVGRIEPIRVAEPPPANRPVRVLASKSHMNAHTTEFIRQLGAHELVQAGSSLKFCRVAEGVADVYPRMGPTCEWDTAAAQAIVEAAGGYVSQLDGFPVRYGKQDVLNPNYVVSSVPLASLPGNLLAHA
ncbi:MAG TPA: 3'(2'),5'-bisphosphate nucleotidase CysQ [Burkholderiaceae bacterium]|nr:3'(2'),5'-bisphosphate nucleotidase CysQ [Burkholderiaceae bacterium]HNW01816.1 3'(2'),5'-bisphosphate nucleotidase CysQ [Burkholderiaceae bacterium]HPW07720.1 3'(2'),5'-bisphosphate nucleotidase CysQ [Burkholderiaceae bacterium]